MDVLSMLQRRFLRYWIAKFLKKMNIESLVGILFKQPFKGKVRISFSPIEELLHAVYLVLENIRQINTVENIYM